MTLTLNQVDVHEEEEEVDHQDTDIKPAFGRNFALITSDFSLIDFSIFPHHQLYSGRRCPCPSDVRASVLRVKANSVASPNRVKG